MTYHLTAFEELLLKLPRKFSKESAIERLSCVSVQFQKLSVQFVKELKPVIPVVVYSAGSKEEASRISRTATFSTLMVAVGNGREWSRGRE